MTKPIRYAILGAGIPTAKIAAAIDANAGSKLVAIDNETLSNEQLADKLAVKKATPEAIVAQKDIDVIYVVGSNQQHYRLAKLALTNEKHVIVERPLTSHKVGASELYALAKAKHKLLLEGQVGLVLPLVKLVKQALASKKIGQLRFVEVKGYYQLAEQSGWFLSLAQGGGALNLGGSYPLQLVPYLLDSEISEWSGHCVNANGQADTQCFLGFKVDDVLVSCLLASGMEGDSKVVFVGTKGKITIREYWHANQADVELTDGTQSQLKALVTHKNEYEYLLDHMNDCLNQTLGQSPIITPQRTITAMSVIEDLYNQWYGDPLN